jgi:hypothetical protein
VGVYSSIKPKRFLISGETSRPENEEDAKLSSVLSTFHAAVSPATAVENVVDTEETPRCVRSGRGARRAEVRVGTCEEGGAAASCGGGDVRREGEVSAAGSRASASYSFLEGARFRRNGSR